MAELKNNSSGYSFVDLSNPEKCGGLIQVLESLMPSSVQMLNLIRVKQDQMFCPDRVPVFQFWSYEKEKNECMESSSTKDWNDKSKPLFLVCLVGTKYKMEDVVDFQFRMMYSRETPCPQDSHLVSQFSLLFDFYLSGDMIFSVMDNHRYVPFLCKVVSLHGREAKAYPNWTMYLRMEKALDFATDLEKINEYSIRPLDPDDASIVNSNWKFGNLEDGTLTAIRDQIIHSTSAGIFLQSEENDKVKDEDLLACWAISMPTGTINALQTRSDCRRRGLAENAIKYISYNLAKKGIFPLVEIEPESEASKKLMEKLGFELAFNAAWVYCKRV